MKRLTVIYDASCGLCSTCRSWLSAQPAYIQLVFIPLGSDEVARRFPDLVSGSEPDQLVAVSDEGGVYRGEDAWIMCLYALEGYREWSFRLASPATRPLARSVVGLVSRSRHTLSRWLGMRSDDELGSRRI